MISANWALYWAITAFTKALVEGINGKADLKAGFLAASVTILIGGVLWLIGSFFLERDTALAPHRLGEPR